MQGCTHIHTMQCNIPMAKCIYKMPFNIVRTFQQQIYQIECITAATGRGGSAEIEEEENWKY